MVEDEAKLRKLAVKMLERLGLQTLQAETAKDALGFSPTRMSMCCSPTSSSLEA